MNESQKQEKQLIEDAVASGIRKAFLEIGIDTSNPHSIKEAQKNMAYLSSARKGSEEMGKHVKRAAIGVFVFSTLYGLWVGFQQLIHTPVK